MLSYIMRYALLTLFIQPILTIPFLHSVNKVDLNGNVCVLPNLRNQQCPLLCASSIDRCPSAQKPTCPTNHVYCVDGSCQQFCPPQLISQCACSDVKYRDWFPCNGTLLVDLISVHPSNKSAALTSACQNTILTNPALSFITCEPLPTPIFSMDLLIWIFLFSYKFIQVLIIGAFLIYRNQFVANQTRSVNKCLKSATRKSTRTNEKHLIEKFRHDSFLDTQALLHAHQLKLNAQKMDKQSSPPEATRKSSSEYSSIPVSSVTFKYYKNHFFGTFAFYCSVAWVLLTHLTLLLIVLDYYMTLDGAEPLNFDSVDQIPYAFVLVWHLMVFTMLAWKLAGVVRIRNWCRIPVDNINEAEFVVISRAFVVQPTTNVQTGLLGSLFAFIHKIDCIADEYLCVNTHLSEQRILVSKHLLVPYFYFECVRFVYSPITKDFSEYPYSLGNTVGSVVQLANHLHTTGGLSSSSIHQRIDLVGLNEIDIPHKSFFTLWISELSGWFYLYQGSCLWIWYYFSYWQMGLVLSSVIMIASVVKSNVSYKSHRRVRELAAISKHVSTYRNSEWTLIDSTQLVPGDIIRIQTGPLSTDTLLVQGQTLLDESSLTGESRPIRKFPALETETSLLNSVMHKRNVLLAGTQVLQADSDSFGIILKTNVNTSRGQMIQKMLHPKPIQFIFDEQLKIVLLLMLAWGIVCFSLVIYFMGPASISSWFYAMFIISEIISPLLPAVLVAGQSVAAERLVRNHSIYCVDLPRITMAGKVQIVCFDKTGTLTLEGLDMWGYLPASTDLECTDWQGSVPALNSDYKSLTSLEQQGLATAHSVSSHNNELVGNPVDVSMFEFTNCSIVDNKITSASDTRIGIVIKRWDFVHAKQTMAVLVENANDRDEPDLTFFVKGSYERVRAMCTSGVPHWYDTVARIYAKRGGYVLALASKPCLLSRQTAKQQSRDHVESDLTLLGLIVFRNALKPDSESAVAELRAGKCRTVMISGDNLFTCVHIARECKLTPVLDNKQHARFLYGDIAEPASVHYHGLGIETVGCVERTSSQIEWRDIDTELLITPEEFELLWQHRNVQPLDLAVTGAAWDVLMKTDLADRYLLSIRIWGRMSPEQKVEVVQLHMQNNNVTVAMVGDGGNDCGALNAAHVGIALSETEASIVAPFSSKSKSVQSVVLLIAEGRAALATSFSGFKFLIMYGMTMSSFCLVQFYFSVVLPQMIWIYIDGIIVVSTIYALAQSKPLTRLLPRRPTAQLLGPQTLISILVQTVINWTYLFMGIYWLFQQPWFRCHEFDSSAVDAAKWWLMGDNYESTIISVIVVHQFINNGAVFNFGHFYRQSWISNRIYVALYATLMLIVATLLLTGPNWFTCLFRINCGSVDQELVSLNGLLLSSSTALMDIYNNPWGNNILPQYFRWQLWAYVLSNVVLGLSAERLLVLGPVLEWTRNVWPMTRQHIPL